MKTLKLQFVLGHLLVMLLCNLTVSVEKQLKYIRSSHRLDFTTLVREIVKLSYLASVTHTRIGALSLIITSVL